MKSPALIARLTLTCFSIAAGLITQAHGQYTLHDIPLPTGATSPTASLTASGLLIGRYQKSVNHAFTWKNGVYRELTPSNATGSFIISTNSADLVAGLVIFGGIGDSNPAHTHAGVWTDGVFTDITPAGALGSNVTLPISENGVVAGTFTPAGFPDGIYSFVWSNGSSVVLNPSGSTSCIVAAENSQGLLAGQYDVPDPSNPILTLATRAFIWSNGTFTELPSAFTNSVAVGVNNSGTVIGYAWNSSSNIHPVIWNSGTETELPTASGAVSTYTTDINGAGQIIGYFQTTATGPKRACTWINGSFTDLGLPPTAAVNDNSNFDPTERGRYKIDDEGQITGTFELDDNADRHAFIWKAGTLTVLFPQTTLYSVIASENSAGRFIGDFADSNDHRRAFTWLGGVATDLTPANANTVPVSGNVISTVTSISDTGRIAGTFTAPSGFTHAFTWDNGTSIDVNPSGADSSTATVQPGSDLIVGSSNTDAFIWDNGTTTRLFPAKLRSTLSYNDGAGNIAGSFTDSDNTVHAYLLTLGGSYPADQPIPTPTPSPTPSSTPAATPSNAAPTVTVNGKKKITTAKAAIKISGLSTGEVGSVTYRVGTKGAYKKAKGTAKWSFTAKLKPGKNIVTVIVNGPTGPSAPIKITVVRG